MSVAPIGALGGLEVGSLQGEAAGGVAGAGPAPGATGTEGAGQAPGATGGEGSFSSALTNALESLEQAQTTAGTAAGEVAMGSTSDPEGAIVKVQDAQLEMDLASQIRTKATEALQNIFQTQI